MLTLDDFENTDYSEAVVPFQFREETDREGTHKWLKLWFEREYEKAHGRFVMYRRYINMYKNLEEYNGMAKSQALSAKKKQKIRDNIVYSYTQQRVSQVSKQKTAIAYIPRVHNSQEDINATKATKLLVRARHEERNFEGDMLRTDTITYLLGHSLYEVGWDKTIGGLAPSYNRAKEAGKIKDVEKVFIGDTCGKLWQPFEFFPEPGRARLEHCDYVQTHEWKTKQYIEKKHKLKPGTITDSEYVKWDFGANAINRPSNEILVRTFWHRPTEFFPEGCKIVWCEDRILEWIDFPYDHGKLPFIEEKDIEIEGEFWGRPFVTNIEQFYKLNNSLISGMARNHGILNAPKVMAPEGSVDAKSWSNEYSFVQYRGPVEPKILQHNYVNRGELDFQKHCQSRAGELSAIYDISRGIVPPGITAASAIRYLDEQEHQRASPSIIKRKRRILDIVRMEIAVMSQHYKDSDERTVRLVGENNEFIIKSFKKLALNRVADVRLENTSSLSDTKSGAIADIIDLNAVTQNDPVFKPKQIIQMLDMGLSDAFKDEAAVAIDTARTILDQILDGEQAPPPSKTDGLAEMYSVFGRFVESLVYKTKLAPEIKTAIDDYIMGIEILMWQKSVENTKFATILTTFEKYPMFFSPPQPPQPIAPPTQGGGAPGGADTGAMELQKKNIETQMNEESKQ